MIMKLQTLAKDNPQIDSLRIQAQTLESEIKAMNQQVTGGVQSLASKAVEYQRLALEKDYCDKLLASAMNTLELARNQALRQQFYLERIVQPSKPDWPEEPRRIRNIVATLLLGLISWGVVTLLVAAVKEHHD